MPKKRSPRKGSLQYWPRARAKKIRPRVRKISLDKAGLSGFAGYKVGMVHVCLLDERKNSMTKGERITVPATIIECPPLRIFGIRFYKIKDGVLFSGETVLNPKLDKILSRIVQLPKKKIKAIDEVKIEDYDDLAIIVYTMPKLTGVRKKKPELFEMSIGGKDIKEKVEFVKGLFDKEIKVSDVFGEGALVDVHAVTKGKGFQGAVKRFGVAVRQHKSEKTKRGPGTLGPWTPKRVSWTVPQTGKMGFHQRTEYNKLILKIGKAEEINKPGGYLNYGVLKCDFVLLKGSIPGSRKRLIIFTAAKRPNDKLLMVPKIEKIIK